MPGFFNPGRPWTGKIMKTIGAVAVVALMVIYGDHPASAATTAFDVSYDITIDNVTTDGADFSAPGADFFGMVWADSTTGSWNPGAAGSDPNARLMVTFPANGDDWDTNDVGDQLLGGKTLDLVTLRLDGIICDGASGVGDQLTHFAADGTFKIFNLCGAGGQVVLYEGTVTVTPKVNVGGTTSFLAGSSDSLAEGSSSSSGSIAILIAIAAGAFAILAVGGWSARRRWSGRRS